MEKIQYYLAQLDKELSKHPYFKTAEKATGIPKSYLVVGASFCLALLIVFNVFASFLTTLIGFLYPAYASFKAIESKDHKDDTQWLTYWVAFSAFNILEFLSDLILYWIPFYYLFKTAIILWLFLPQFKVCFLTLMSRYRYPVARTISLIIIIIFYSFRVPKFCTKKLFALI